VKLFMLIGGENRVAKSVCYCVPRLLRSMAAIGSVDGKWGA
jgi:hypothetical protein